MMASKGRQTSTSGTLLSFLTLAVGTAMGATSFTENFDASTSLPAGWTSSGSVSIETNPAYAVSGNNTLSIESTRNSNLWTTPTLGLAGATEATISFWWSTGPNSGAFGRFPQLQYSNDGVNFSTFAQISVPANAATVTAPTFFSDTVTTAGDGFAFSANSVFRIVGDNDGGGNGAPFNIDDFSVTSNAIPEPSTALLGGLGVLALLRRRR